MEHVSGEMNPADDASRGLTGDIFLRQGRWLMGPEFLWKPEPMWPIRREPISNVSDEDPEVKKEVKACISSIGKPSSLLSDYFLK